MGDDRPVRYEEERVTDDGKVETVVVYRASGFGSCTRVFVAHANSRIPAPTPAWMQEVFDQGHEFEPLIRQAHADKVGGVVTDDQLEVELDLGMVYGKRVVIRGHIDGVIEDEHGRRLFEAKKIRDSGWGNFLSKGIELNVNYPWQESIYMHGLELTEADFVGGHVVNHGTEDLPDWVLVETECIPITQPPFNMKAIRARVKLIEGLIRSGLDAPEVDCQRSQYPCPFYKLHDWDEDEYELPTEGDAAEVVKILLDELADISAKSTVANAEVKRLTAEKKQVSEGLRAWVESQGDVANGAKKFTGFGYTLTRDRSTPEPYTVTPSPRDTFKVKRDGTATKNLSTPGKKDA